MPRNEPAEAEILSAYNSQMQMIAARDGTDFTPVGTATEPAAAAEPAAAPANDPSDSPLGGVFGADAASAIGTLRRFGLSDRDAAALSAGKPLSVTADQREQAEIRKEQLFRDPTWVKAFLDGDRHAAAQIIEINIRLTANVV